MVRSSLMALLVSVWTVALPSDLHAVQRALLVAGVVALVHMAYCLGRTRRAPSRVLILGNGPMAAALIEELESSRDPRYVLTGVVNDEPLREGTRAAWLGRMDRLAAILEDVRPDRIVVALSDRRGRLPLQPLLESRARGVAVEDALEFYERITGKIAIEALTPGALINARGFRTRGTPEQVARVVSVTVAVAGLVLLAPLLAAIAMAIRYDSQGPIVFVQERIGREGRPFKLLKFRTMRPRDGQRSEWVQDNSDRITRIGKWLRRFRLDELPQLVNILQGEMNLVGPRPHPTCNQEIFMERIAYYGLRSIVRPGVTGWAQCRYGYANNIEEETEKMRYDLYYIKNRSLRLDFGILMQTTGIMVLGQGSSSVLRPRPITVPVPVEAIPSRQ
jgi:exopolysaccharide biosynthesis polyprenyl glycosylphosphotransferase